MYSTPLRTPSSKPLRDLSINRVNNAGKISNNINESSTIPTSPNDFTFKKVEFNCEENKQKIILFEEFLNNYVNTAKNNLSIKKQQWQSSLALDRGNITRYTEDIKSLEKKQKDLITTLEKEKKELYKIQTEISNLKNEELMKNERKNTLLKQIETVKKNIQKQRDVLAEKQVSLELQLSKNEPELKLFEDRLALTMEGVRDDAITFTFTCVYENDSSRPCSFTIDVGETKYTVFDCNPPLDQVLEELVSHLNSSRDFFSFIKRMRQAFRKKAQEA
ncbi:3851_t:CDS:2 [Acaulospora morrowiae]|uniref:Kinetochore protein SPC25 n=1 Tax=Acaulospora morrowiae TaxID=94023 RepID=A0A9N8V3X6_9GLOM|nr:3851_t:CDS:2 [Acaulospora morrowiae]